MRFKLTASLLSSSALAVVPAFADSVPISGLPVAGALTGPELIPLTQGFITKQTTPLALATFIRSTLPPAALSGSAADLTGVLHGANMPAFAGDCSTTIGSVTLTCTKAGGVAFAPSATTDATNASNITSGTLPSARIGGLGTPSSGVLTNATGLPLGTGVTGLLPPANGGCGVASLSGLLKGNGTSPCTAAVAGTDYVPPKGSGTGLVFMAPYLTSTTCSIDQTSIIQTVASANPAGAWLLFPPGCIAIGATGTLTNTQQNWNGTGPGPSGTTFAYSQPTGKAFQLTGNAASLQGMTIYDSYSGGSSSAVGITQGASTENPTRQSISDVYVHDFTTNIDVESGYFWSWKRVWSRNFGIYGGLIRNLNYSDNGDWSITDFVGQYDGTSPPTGAAILRAESGGSGKISNSKFLGAQYALDWSQQDSQINTPPGTGDLNFTNNSVENQSVAGIRLQAGPTSTFGSVSISSNELAGQQTAISVGANIYNTSVTGNVFTTNNYGVQVLPGAKGFMASGNNFNAYGVAAISLSEGSTDVYIGPNGYSNVIGKYRVLDQRTVSSGQIENSETRPLVLSASSAASQVYSINLNPYRTVTATIQVEGLVNNVGPVSQELSVRMQNNGTTGIVTTLSSTSSGTPPAVTFDTSTTAGVVNVNIAGAAGGTFTGSMSIRLVGKLSALVVQQ